MTFEKYTQELTTLTTFVAHYCRDKHIHVPKRARQIPVCYGGESDGVIETMLCEECLETVSYGIERLEGCPYDEKPKCRRCSDPCYERPMWKRIAAIMRYSGMKLGMTKLRKKIRFWSDQA